MNPAYSTYELIDRYLDKELNPAEMDDFLARMATDKDFAEKVELQQLAHDYILDKEMIELKEKMKEDLSNYSNNFYKNILLSTTLFILMISGVIYYFRPNSESPKIQPKSQSPLRDFSNAIDTNSRSSVESITKDPIIDKVNEYHLSNKDRMENTIDSMAITKNNNPFYEPQTSIIDLEKTAPKLPETITGMNMSNPCEGITLSADINVSNSCENKATGTIKINDKSIKGGKEPYLISFNQSNYSKETNFHHLSSGNYLIKIKDANNCYTSIEKEILGEVCKKMIDDAFMPTQGEVWKYPVEENRNASIQLFNEQGVPVFQISSLAAVLNEWDGKDNSGNSLPAGLYHFIIKYDDGETEKGRITILK